jgi:hypothetical protein
MNIETWSGGRAPPLVMTIEAGNGLRGSEAPEKSTWMCGHSVRTIPATLMTIPTSQPTKLPRLKSQREHVTRSRHIISTNTLMPMANFAISSKAIIAPFGEATVIPLLTPWLSWLDTARKG